MIYQELHQVLKAAFDRNEPEKRLPELNVSITHQAFVSEDAAHILPGSEQLGCAQHQLSFDAHRCVFPQKEGALDSSDFDISCNRHFQFHVIRTLDPDPAPGAVLLFHGLNEKKWDKYLPWAYAIAQNTGKAVILFPIAFHMDRAPEHWSNKKEMFAVAQSRASAIDNAACSYLNAAISVRMEALPQRLFWSGLQTYGDSIQLAKMLQSGLVNGVAAGASLDLFGYSIGSFLSSILMMANPEGLFARTRLFCFCGGMTIDRMFPISKYILDAQSAIAMQSCFAELLSSGFAADERMEHYQDKAQHEEESWFKTMLRYNYFQQEREDRLEAIKDRVMALVLKDDEVAPPVEALNTLQGGYRNIAVPVQIDHYEHPYSHINPFPLTSKYAHLVDQSFRNFARTVSDFYKS